MPVVYDGTADYLFEAETVPGTFDAPGSALTPASTTSAIDFVYAHTEAGFLWRCTGQPPSVANPVVTPASGTIV